MIANYPEHKLKLWVANIRKKLVDFFDDTKQALTLAPQ